MNTEEKTKANLLLSAKAILCSTQTNPQKSESHVIAVEIFPRLLSLAAPCLPIASQILAQ